ncbi:MAG: hypothetical protein WC343_09380 [Bacilli bacterium]|jgi:hypothetical protein
MDFSSFPRALLEGLQAEIEAELFARDEEKLSEQVLIEILA